VEVVHLAHQFSKEAEVLVDAVRNFAVLHNLDPDAMLDEMYNQLTGIERVPMTPTPTTAASASSNPAPYTQMSAVATPPAPFPMATDHATMETPVFVIPNDALIGWGKLAGQKMEELHTDLAYVRWLVANRNRFKNADAMMVLQYIDQFYSLEGQKEKNYLRKRGEMDRGPMVNPPTCPPQPRSSLEEAMPDTTTRPAAATTRDDHMKDLVRALLARMSRD
jgi:hypothetical protein